VHNNGGISQVPEGVAQLLARAAQRRGEAGLSALEIECLDGILETDWQQATPAEVAWLRARSRDVLA
jgi:hypothetical protein